MWKSEYVCSYHPPLILSICGRENMYVRTINIWYSSYAEERTCMFVPSTSNSHHMWKSEYVCSYHPHLILGICGRANMYVRTTHLNYSSYVEEWICMFVPSTSATCATVARFGAATAAAFCKTKPNKHTVCQGWIHKRLRNLSTSPFMNLSPLGSNFMNRKHLSKGALRHSKQKLVQKIKQW